VVVTLEYSSFIADVMLVIDVIDKKSLKVPLRIENADNLLLIKYVFVNEVLSVCLFARSIEDNFLYLFVFAQFWKGIDNNSIDFANEMIEK
jgi:hypothetical protein